MAYNLTNKNNFLKLKKSSVSLPTRKELSRRSSLRRADWLRPGYLDFSIKYKIPQSDYAPIRKACRGRFTSLKHKFTHMPPDNYQKRAEMNVIGSEGALIVSHFSQLLKLRQLDS